MKCKAGSFQFLLVALFFMIVLKSGAQTAGEKSSHQSLYVQVFQSKQIFKSEFASSDFKFGLTVGALQHFDLGSSVQLRIGAGLSFYKIEEIDYTITFGMDPGFFHSYIHNKVDFIQLNLPLNVRYKLFGEEDHVFISCGIEGSIVLHDDFSTSIGEYLAGEREIDHTPFFNSRSAKLAGQLEVGYEFKIGERKMILSMFGKYGFLSQFKGEADWLINSGKPLDLGINLGLVL